MRPIFALTFAFLLSACATPPAPLIAVPTPCPEEPAIPEVLNTDKEFIKWVEQVRMSGAECRRKYKALVAHVEAAQ